MQRDLADIIDRYSISKLKAERIGNEENKREYNAFRKEVLKIERNGNLVYLFQFIFMAIQLI